MALPPVVSPPPMTPAYLCFRGHAPAKRRANSR